MGRKHRTDAPGWTHHVYNRGLGQRAIFEDSESVDVFSAFLDEEVRAGQIEVTTHSFLTNHFHLGLVSLTGELSAAMQRVEAGFVRWFNRRHGRDGPLFRSRFGSRRIYDDAQLATLVRYIDANPVAAGLVDFPEEYPFGSARAFLRGPMPRWLSRRWFDQELEDLLARGLSWESAYRLRFNALEPDDVFLVEQRMRNRPSRPGDLADLIGAAPRHVIEWFRERAHIADGGAIGAPIVGPCAVAAVLVGPTRRDPDWMIRFSRRGTRAWPLVETGLLRHLCAMSFDQIAQRLSCSTTTACRRYRQHQEAMVRFKDYESSFVSCALGLM